MDENNKPQKTENSTEAEYLGDSLEKAPETKKKRSKGCCFFIFFIMPLAFLVALLVIAGILGFLGYKGYKIWQEDFESVHLDQEYYQLDDKPFVDATKSVESKLKTFEASQEEVDFIELTPIEVTALVHSTLRENLPKEFEVTRYFVIPAEGKWDIYMQGQYKDYTTPWISLRLEKDNIETAQLFVSRINIGDFNIAEYGFKSVLDDVNSGYIEGITLINEGDFTSRVIENIELGADKLVIKGRLRE
ncbi:MAG: hypothetical protein Fur003_0070 [Candidatus Dojkabacteria bacterium]